MVRVFVWALLASVQASRVAVHDASATRAQWGASCETLQNQFHDRVASIQGSLEGVDETSELSAVARTRLGMRMYGIMRTLRRASECSWVIENNSDDLEQMRGVVQGLLAGNPCADAARSELERGSSDENPEAIPRAMNILLSDDCEVPEEPEGANTDDAPTDLQEVEDALQDRIDELDEDGSSFIEMEKSQTLRSFLRGVGVFFLMAFLLLACTATAAAIAFFLTWGGLILLINVFGRSAIWGSRRCDFCGLGELFLGTFVGGAIGIPSCAYQLYTNLLPRLQ